MKAEVLGFGEIELDGERYDHDIVITAGEVKKRKKGVSKRFRDEYGHTPLSAEEDSRALWRWDQCSRRPRQTASRPP
jgi:hypothetical protein